MATQVTQQQDNNLDKQVIPMVAGYYGGAIGGAAAQQAVSSNNSATVTSPVNRRMEQQENVASLREGLDAARNSDNPEMQQYTPYLEEAMKKAKVQRGGGNVA